MQRICVWRWWWCARRRGAVFKPASRCLHVSSVPRVRQLLLDCTTVDGMITHIASCACWHCRRRPVANFVLHVTTLSKGAVLLLLLLLLLLLCVPPYRAIHACSVQCGGTGRRVGNASGWKAWVLSISQRVVCMCARVFMLQICMPPGRGCGCVGRVRCGTRSLLAPCRCWQGLLAKHRMCAHPSAVGSPAGVQEPALGLD